MIKLTTSVETGKSAVKCGLGDKILLLGSCFSDEMALRMQERGFDISANPFGTLYNPASIAYALELLSGPQGKEQGVSGGAPKEAFTPEDCEEMGAGSGRICSFRHHTSFARDTQEAFLEHANAELAKAREFWKDCNKVIITLGSANVWEHHRAGIVANCLKRDAKEFTHRMLSMEECRTYLEKIVELCRDRDVIFTVSPIRHMSLGAHNNSLSKATLHLSLENVLAGKNAQQGTSRAEYFPAYEILCDELRDYRFYGEDLVHPSKTAVDIIWERFTESFVPREDREKMQNNLKEFRRRAHRPISD